MKVIIFILLLFISSNDFTKILTSTNYDELEGYEKKFLQKFSLDSVNALKNYRDTFWQVQEINEFDIKQIFALRDTTIILFFKPSCYGFDKIFKKIQRVNKEIKDILIVVSESYFLGSIQSTFVQFKYNKQAYVIDKSYGKDLKLAKANFCKAVFKQGNDALDEAIFVWVDKSGKILRVTSKL